MKTKTRTELSQYLVVGALGLASIGFALHCGGAEGDENLGRLSQASESGGGGGSELSDSFVRGTSDPLHKRPDALATTHYGAAKPNPLAPLAFDPAESSQCYEGGPCSQNGEDGDLTPADPIVSEQPEDAKFGTSSENQWEWVKGDPEAEQVNGQLL